MRPGNQPPQRPNIPDVRRQESDANTSRTSRKIMEKRTGRKQRMWQNGAPCSFCGVPIMQTDLSTNPTERDIEETWCVHYKCRMAALNRLDRDSGMADQRK
jgi:hypothetical protein